MGIRCDPFGMARAHRTTTAFFRHHTVIRLVLAIGLIVAGLVSWANSEPATVTKPIVVAARDIASGASLTAADLSTGYDSLGLADVDPAALLGETARGPISEGEPITMSRITPGRSLTVESGRVVFPLPLPDCRRRRRRCQSHYYHLLLHSCTATDRTTASLKKPIVDL